MNWLFKRFTHSASSVSLLLRTGRARKWAVGDAGRPDRIAEPGADIQQAKKQAGAIESCRCLNWRRFFREGSPGGLLGGSGIAD